MFSKYLLPNLKVRVSMDVFSMQRCLLLLVRANKTARLDIAQVQKLLQGVARANAIHIADEPRERRHDGRV